MDLSKNPPPSYYDASLNDETLSFFANHMLEVFHKLLKILVEKMMIITLSVVQFWKMP